LQQKEIKNEIEWIDNAYANNEYVGLKDQYSDEFQGNDWLDMTVVENITVEHNKSDPPTTTGDLRVGDIFESKIKLLQVISEWCIAYSVSFKPVKINRTCYTAICDVDNNGGGKSAMETLCLSPKKFK